MIPFGQSAQDLFNKAKKTTTEAIGGAMDTLTGSQPPVQPKTQPIAGPQQAKTPASADITAPGVGTGDWIGDFKQPEPVKPVQQNEQLGAWIGDFKQETPQIQSGASSDSIQKPISTETPQNGPITPTETQTPTEQPTVASMDSMYAQRQQIAENEKKQAIIMAQEAKQQQEQVRQARDIGFAQTELNRQSQIQKDQARKNWEIQNMQAKDTLEKYARNLDQVSNRQGMNSLAIGDARKAMETQNLIYNKMVEDNDIRTQDMLRGFEKAQADINQRMIDTVGARNKETYAKVIAGLTQDDSITNIQRLSELMQLSAQTSVEDMQRFALAKDQVSQQYAKEYEAFKQQQATEKAMSLPDDKLSKLAGVLMNSSGQPILDVNGQPTPIPKELDKTISDDEGNVYAIYKDGSSQIIQGAKEKVTAQQLQTIDIGGKVMLYNPRTGKVQEVEKTLGQKDIADIQMRSQELQFKREDSAQDRQLKMQQQAQQYGIDLARVQIDGQRLSIEKSKAGKDNYDFIKGEDGELLRVNKTTGQSEPVTPAEATSQNNIEVVMNGKYPLTGTDEKGRLVFDLSKAPKVATAGDVNATQCGRFVNELTGRAYGFGDSIKQKESLITQKNRMEPTIGAVFVKQYAKTGHVGIVSGVDRDPETGELKGIYITDRNGDGRGTIRQNAYIGVNNPFFKQISGYVENKKGLPKGYENLGRKAIDNPSMKTPPGVSKKQVMAEAERIDNKWSDNLQQVPGLDLEIGGHLAGMTDKQRNSWRETLSKSIEAKDPYAVKRNLQELMKTKMSSEQRSDYSIEQESLSSMKKAKKELETLIQGGMETGPMRKLLQKGVLKVTGTDYKPDLTSVEGRILDALQKYRSKITGAAWGAQEEEEYAKMFGDGSMDEQTLLKTIDNFLTRAEERSLDRFASQYGQAGEGLKQWADSIKAGEQEQRDLEMQEDIYNRGQSNMALMQGLQTKGNQKVVDQAINDEATASQLLYGQ